MANDVLLREANGGKDLPISDESPLGFRTPEDCRELARTSAITTGSILGHNQKYISAVCERLGLAVIDWSTVEHLESLGHNAHKKNIGSLPALPAIVTIQNGAEAGHVILLTGVGQRMGVFSLDQLYSALSPKSEPARNLPQY